MSTLKHIYRCNGNLGNTISFIWVLTFTLLLSFGWLPSQGLGKGSHFIAINSTDKPKYKATFKHFDYVNPDSKKYGNITLSALGSFDSLNPFISKGDSATGMVLLYDLLVEPSGDEHSVGYGRLAEKIYTDKSRTWVAFKIHPKARWHDGKKVTADDLIWTYNILIKEGDPFYKFYYEDVKNVIELPNNTVKFEFSKANQELPFILGQIRVLPKHYWEGKDFSSTDLTPPLGSGPYRIGKIVPGSSVTFERVKDYWGANIPVNKGIYNFDEITYEYYRDQNVMREALKAGKIDFNTENTAKEWAKSYDIRVVREGRLIKKKLPDLNPSGLQALMFNIRNPLFKDPQVRYAINLAFDFEWLNKTFFFNEYIRSSSYFNNSEMAARKLPSPAELKILNQFKGKVPKEVFTKVYNPPKTDGSGNNRDNLKEAVSILRKAGWQVKDGVLTETKTGQQMKFSILTYLPTFEKIFLPFTKNLKRLGIIVNIQVLNPAQFQNKVRDFDFDVLQGGAGQSDSPGNEQLEFWGSKAADTKGSRNYIGIKDPVVDEVIDLITKAKTREELITRVRVLDRILIWSHYVIPQWHYPYLRILYWNKFDIPKKLPKYSFNYLTWSINPSLEKKLDN